MARVFLGVGGDQHCSAPVFVVVRSISRGNEIMRCQDLLTNILGRLGQCSQFIIVPLCAVQIALPHTQVRCHNFWISRIRITTFSIFNEGVFDWSVLCPSASNYQIAESNLVSERWSHHHRGAIPGDAKIHG